jgi:hypothetical protein
MGVCKRWNFSLQYLQYCTIAHMLVDHCFASERCLLLDALTHGFITIARLSLCVFDGGPSMHQERAQDQDYASLLPSC